MDHSADHSARTALGRANWALFAAILAGAFALRMSALVPASMHHPDEIFQYLEPAHRMVFGQGLVTWEYRYGMRGWLLPTVLSWPMRLGADLAPDGQLYLILPRMTAALLSLSIPVSAFGIGRRLSRAHAFVAMAVMSVWFESVYFSTHVLSEQISTILALPAMALMMAAGPRTSGRYLAAGLLFGFAVAIRFHHGPAVFVFAVAMCGRDVRGRWCPMIVGGVIALTVSGLADLAHGAIPFAWVAANFQQNVVQDQASKFGVASPIFYLGAIALSWRWMLPALVLAIRPAVARHRALFAAALVNIALLSLIGHKEYRFILLSTTILVLLAALGSVDLVKGWSDRRGRSGWIAAWVALAVSWAAGSASLAVSGHFLPLWEAPTPALSLVTEAGRRPGLCGLAIDRQPFWRMGGYLYLHRKVPVYITHPKREDHIGDETLSSVAAAFNAVITPAAAVGAIPKSFAVVSCRGEGDYRLCLMQRPGGCTATPAAQPWEIDTAMRRNDL